MDITSIINRAQALGAEHGRNAGSWVIDGNTTDVYARAIVQGYEDGDPQVMEMMPAPLSGEWADSMTPDRLLRELGYRHDGDIDMEPDICGAYELAFERGFWDQVSTDARGFGHIA